MKTRIVYVVKFNCGYYAKKQVGRTWVFTDDIDDAALYTSEKTAKERGELGLELYYHYDHIGDTPTVNYGNYVVECYQETIELKEIK